MASSPPRLRAVFFDLDGTLVDSLGDIADSANAVLEDLGHPTHPREAYRKFIGDGARTLVERMMPPGTSEPRIDEVLAIYLEVYGANLGQSTEPFPGMTEVVGELKAQGFLLGVCTNKPHELTLPCVADCFPGEPFAYLAGARPEVPVKPAPDIHLLGLERLGVDPGDAAFVGDSDVDMLSAVAAGMRPIGVSWGMRDEEELRNAGAEQVIDEARELLEL